MGLEATIGLVVALSEGVDASRSADLVRGAIGGAFVIGVSFLTGVAVFQRRLAPVSALVMVIAAALLEFAWIKLFSPPSAAMMTFLQGLFGASVLFFLASSIQLAKRSAIVGGLMVAGALCMLGLGAFAIAMNFDAATPVRYSLYGVAAFSGILVLSQAISGDPAARMLLPGVAIMAVAPFAGRLGGPEAAIITPHALFTFGVLATSLITLVDGRRTIARAPTVVTGGYADLRDAPSYTPRSSDDGDYASIAAGGGDASEYLSPGADGERTNAAQGEASLVSNNQLAEVLDYSGVSVWDWSPRRSQETTSFGSLLGLGPMDDLSPATFSRLLKEPDALRFDQIVATATSDGPFDLSVSLKTGDRLRLRGARAVDDGGVLERVVMFVERVGAADQAKTPTIVSLDAGNAAEAAAAGGVVAAAIGKAMASRHEPGVGTSEGLQANGVHDGGDASQSKSGLQLAKALKDGRVRAAFQPIVSLEDEKVRGYEALARISTGNDDLDDWTTEELVNVAQRQGCGFLLAETMLKASASFLEEKLEEPDAVDGLFVAFNASIGQLQSEGFVDAVAEEIERRDLPKNSLVLELTEADAVRDDAFARETFAALKRAGAALAFDDFGAGFSSLSNLHKFSFDYLKVDKSFVEELTDPKSDAHKIVSALAGLGDNLGMGVIAEGVSSKTLADAAKESGCSLAQGYLFGEPTIYDLNASIEEGGSPSALSEKLSDMQSEAKSRSAYANGAHNKPKQTARQSVSDEKEYADAQDSVFKSDELR
ncbi:MAG: EAL domain-containing protein [Pseudomonadota bacterium]